MIWSVRNPCCLVIIIAISACGGTYDGNEQGTMLAGALGQALVVENDVRLTGNCSHTLALTIDGTLYAWGSNSDGQLGEKFLNQLK